MDDFFTGINVLIATLIIGRVLKLRTSGSLTAANALSAYQQAALATQKKTNAVTIFLKVVFLSDMCKIW